MVSDLSQWASKVKEANWPIRSIRSVAAIGATGTGHHKNIPAETTMSEDTQASARRSRMAWIVQHGKTAALATLMGAFALVQPAAAQEEFCSTEMGSFTEAITSSFGTIAIAGIVLAILVGVAARPFIRSGGQASALNSIMSKAFAGLIILILFIPIISWGLTFTPFAPATECIPFLGGG